MPNQLEYARDREKYATYARTPRGRESLQRYRRSNKYRVVALRHHLKKKFGLTLEQVADLFVSQRGACACCADPISLDQSAENYRHIDHDHTKVKGEPGFVRGLLCHYCNIGLGAFRDSVEKMCRAIRYLED